MSNKSYNRFRNTLSDLQDCLEHLLNEDLSEEESEARKQIIEVCRKIVDESEKIPDSVSSENYLEGHRASGLKVGDMVTIIRSAADYEGGWNNAWVDGGMDDFINEIGEIQEDSDKIGFKVYSKELKNCFNFPYFCLEKIEDKKK